MATWAHSTYTGYVNHGCRCAGCGTAFAAWMREYRRRRKARTGEKMVHGRFTGGSVPPHPQPDRPLTELLILVLGIFGRPATSTEIFQWMRREGETFTQTQITSRLRYLAERRKIPPVEKADGLWRLTGRGHALLAAD